MSVKPDPTFPDNKDPNRIQVITVIFSPPSVPGKTSPRSTWMQQTKDSFDFAGLAKLLQ